MKARQFQKLANRHIIPNLEGFAAKGVLVFQEPLRNILFGFCFQSSQFDPARFNVEAFVQPLYLPRSHLVFSLGFRLGQSVGLGGKWWNLTERNEKEVMGEVLFLMKDEGLNHFLKLNSPIFLARELQSQLETSKKPNGFYMEVISTSLILAEKKDEAQIEVNRLIYHLVEKDKLREYEKEQLDRMKRLQSLLKKDTVKAALGLINEWRQYSIKHLKLEDFVT